MGITRYSSAIWGTNSHAKQPLDLKTASPVTGFSSQDQSMKESGMVIIILRMIMTMLNVYWVLPVCQVLVYMFLCGFLCLFFKRVPPANAGDSGSIPGWGRFDLWRRKWQPTPVFSPGKSHRQRSLAAYSPWGCKRAGHDKKNKLDSEEGKTTLLSLYLWLSAMLSHHSPRRCIRQHSPSHSQEWTSIPTLIYKKSSPVLYQSINLYGA